MRCLKVCDARDDGVDGVLVGAPRAGVREEVLVGGQPVPGQHLAHAASVVPVVDKRQDHLQWALGSIGH